MRKAKPLGKAVLATAPNVTQTILIRDIVRDAKYQVRVKLDGEAIRRYSNVLGNDGYLPPIRLADIGGVLVLVDGWHRLAAYEERGVREVEAEVTPATASDALWMAAQANLTHGVRLANRDLRNVFRAMIEARQHIPENGRLLSYRELAVKLGGAMQHTTVSNWMKKDFPKIARRMAGGGPGSASREAVRDDEGSLYRSFRAAIENAGACAPGVRRPESRGMMIDDVEQLLKALKAGGDWQTPEF